MKIYIIIIGEVIQVQARAADRNAVGDFTRRIKPGGTLLGYDYAYYQALGEGEHTLMPITTD